MDVRELTGSEIELVAGGGDINWRDVGIATIGGAVGGGVGDGVTSIVVQALTPD